MLFKPNTLFICVLCRSFYSFPPSAQQKDVSMPSIRFAFLSLYSAVIILSINGVFAKAIPFDAVTVTHIRCLIAAIVLLAFTLLQKQSLKLTRTKQYTKVFFLGCLMALHWSAFFKGMQVASVAIGILAHYTYPVLTVIFEPLLYGKRPASGDLIAGLFVLVGVILMVPDWTFNSNTLSGVMFGLISALAFGSRNILQRRWLQGEPGGGVMFYQVLVVALVTLPFTLVLNSYQKLAAASVDVWLMIITLGVVSTALGHALLSNSLRSLSAKTVSLIACLQPPLAILLSWIFIGESPLPITLLGGALILATAAYESLRTTVDRASY